MSTFFRALERAEQERLRRPTAEPTSEPRPAAAAPEAGPSGAPPSVFTRPAVFTPPPAASSKLAAGDAELEEHLVSLLAPTSFEAEQYRVLRHMVEQLHRSTELSVIAVSSPDSGDGKTTTTINLAGALAQGHDARVLLVDADLRGANLAAHLGLDELAAPGFVDAILNANLTLERIARPHPHLNLSVITAGRSPSAPYEVLKSPRVGELFAEARRKYDYVVIDTTPLVSVPDSRVIEKWVDGFLIVVAAHRTPRRLLEEALSLMQPAKIVGMVFNGDDRHVSRETYASRRRRIRRSTTLRSQTALDE